MLEKDLNGEESISREHVDNNKAVRKIFQERGVTPEELPPSEDVARVKRRLAKDSRKVLDEVKKKKKK